MYVLWPFPRWGAMVVQWLALLPCLTAGRPPVQFWIWPSCVEFACSPFTCAGSLWLLGLPPTAQGQPRLIGDSKSFIDVTRAGRSFVSVSALWWTGDSSRLYPAFQPKIASFSLPISFSAVKLMLFFIFGIKVVPFSWPLHLMTLGVYLTDSVLKKCFSKMKRYLMAAVFLLLATDYN